MSDEQIDTKSQEYDDFKWLQEEFNISWNARTKHSTRKRFVEENETITKNVREISNKI